MHEKAQGFKSSLNLDEALNLIEQNDRDEEHEDIIEGYTLEKQIIMEAWAHARPK